ncbi:hypothetical protein FKM82_012702 [Ascaphus truei]
MDRGQLIEKFPHFHQAHLEHQDRATQHTPCCFPPPPRHHHWSTVSTCRAHFWCYMRLASCLDHSIVYSLLEDVRRGYIVIPTLFYGFIFFLSRIFSTKCTHSYVFIEHQYFLGQASALDSYFRLMYREGGLRAPFLQ